MKRENENMRVSRSHEDEASEQNLMLSLSPRPALISLKDGGV